MTLRTNSGENLNKEWHVKARHALYHKDGHYYNVLTKFPGALFDPFGYILFQTKEEFETCPYLKINQQVNVRSDIKNISRIPGYVKVINRSNQ